MMTSNTKILLSVGLTLSLSACIQNSEVSVDDAKIFNNCLSVSASLVGFSNTNIQLNGNASVGGSIVLLGQSKVTLNGNAKVTNRIYAPAVSSVEKTKKAFIQEIVEKDLTAAEASVYAFSSDLDQFASTLVLDEVRTTTTIQGNGSINVVRINGDLSLAGQDSLILSGGANDQFMIDIKGNISFSGKASVKLLGEVSAQKVLFRLMSEGATLQISGNGEMIGTFFAKEGKALISGKGKLTGSLFAKGEIQISGNGFTLDPAPFCPRTWIPEKPVNDSGNSNDSNTDTDTSTDDGSTDADTGSDSGSGSDSGTDSGTGSDTGSVPSDPSTTPPSEPVCNDFSCMGGGVLGV